jgi:hypothetical protein
MTTISHRDARIMICEGFRKLFGHEPARHVAQLVQCVGIIESGYGQYWRAHVFDQLKAKYGAEPAFPTWGAVTAGKSWTGKTFSHGDTRPNSDGSDTPYVTLFRAHDSLGDAAKDLVKQVYLVEPPGYPPRHKTVLPAANAGDVYGFSFALYGYYLGRGKTKEERVAGHHKAVVNAMARMCKALGEDPPNKIDAAAYNEALANADAEWKSWAELRAEALEANALLDVIGTLRTDALREMAGLPPVNDDGGDDVA